MRQTRRAAKQEEITMKQPRKFTIQILILTAILSLPSLTAFAKGKGFKDLTKHIEAQCRAKRKRMPFLGLANFAVRFVHPAGVKGFKVAIYEDHDFTPRPGETPFAAVMREAYKQDWQPLVQARSAGNRTYVYARPSGKDVQFALALFEPRQAFVVEVKLNPEAAMKYLGNPNSLGASLLDGFRLDSLAMKNSARQSSAKSDSLASIGQKMEPAPLSAQPQTSPALRLAENKESKPQENPDSQSETMADQPNAVSAKPVDKDTVRVETRLVNLNVKAVDRSGQPVQDLTAQDFVIHEDGVKQEVAHFTPVTAPINLMLLLDLSGSTEKKRDVMAEAAKKFIDSLGPNDRIAVAAFTRETYLLCAFTTDRGQLKKSVEKINKIQGGTAFYDAMWTTLDWLDKVHDARKAIVVLTDGEDNSLQLNAAGFDFDFDKTRHTFDQLLERVAEEDATIYPIQLAPVEPKIMQRQIVIGPGSSTRDQIRARIVGEVIGKIRRRREIATEQMQALADQTAGMLFKANDEHDLEGVYSRVAAELRQLYSLAYLPENTKRDGGFRKISVNVNRAGAVARTRRGYYAR
jgi:VWFA-related protein